MPRVLLLSASMAIAAAPGFSQTRKTAPPRRAPPPAAMTKVEPDMACPAPLGTGVRTKLAFCEVLAGRDPPGGLVIRPCPRGRSALPPAATQGSGSADLRFAQPASLLRGAGDAGCANRRSALPDPC